jgi:hypothetical protein
VNAPHWRPVDFGLFGWNEVTFCRWSRFEPGLLQVQVTSTRSHQLDLAPMRLFYRVPPPYRSSVEKAIRAMGKWAE